MAETPKREHVGIFNPLILPLPNWHPDGPDGQVDGYAIPFVFPTERASGREPNRGARIRVYPTAHGWRAALMNCQDHAETAAQARAFAGAWIRAAELLDAEVMRVAEERKREAERAEAVDDDVVDAEVIDDEDQDVEPAKAFGDPTREPGGPVKPPRLPGEPLSDMLSETDPPAKLHPDDKPKDGNGPLAGCPACSAGTCTLHTDWANAPDNPDGSCAGCGVYVDGEHDRNCPVYLARLRASRLDRGLPGNGLPFSVGHRVKLLRGDQAGRIGEVIAIWQDGTTPGVPTPAADVRLEATDRLAPKTTTVPAFDVEFVG